MTIRHIVLWKLGGADAAERATQAAEIGARLGALVGVVTEIRALRVDVNVAYPERNADVALTADFDSVEDLEAYQVHPAHVAVGAYVGSVTLQRTAIDYEL